MIRYLWMRLLFMVITLFVVVSIVHMATAYGTLKYTDLSFTQKIQEIFWAYIDYIRMVAFDGEFGIDRHHRDVYEVTLSLAPLTLRLNGYAFLFYTLGGVFLGTLAAIKRNRLTDRIIQSFVLVFNSLPPYLMVMILVLSLGYWLEWLPAQHVMSTSGGIFRQLSGVVIPVLAISSLPLARITRLIRGEMIEAFYSDYLLLLRTKGLNRFQIITRHLLKDCTVALMPELLPMIMYAIFGSFIIEIIYGVPGLSRYLFNSIFSPDGIGFFIDIDLNPVVMVAGFFTLLTLMAAMVVDVTYAMIDPRMRVGNKKP